MVTVGRIMEVETKVLFIEEETPNMLVKVKERVNATPGDKRDLGILKDIFVVLNIIDINCKSVLERVVFREIDQLAARRVESVPEREEEASIYTSFSPHKLITDGSDR
jgi:hypothetical protein